MIEKPPASMLANPSPMLTVQPRAGINGPDGPTDTLPRYACNPGGVVRLGAASSAPDATLTARVVWYDALGTFAGVSSPVVFTTDTTVGPAVAGSAYAATPDPDAWYPAGGPSVFAVQVMAVSAGTWTLLPMAQ